MYLDGQGRGPGGCPEALVQGSLSSAPLPLQAIRRRNVRREDSGRKPERRRLKTARLKEYTIKSHSSMPPNNTYINFERFSKVLDFRLNTEGRQPTPLHPHPAPTPYAAKECLCAGELLLQHGFHR